ncbi:hypothetical protein ACQ4PT_025558 [Festuca glaucescens]
MCGPPSAKSPSGISLNSRRFTDEKETPPLASKCRKASTSPQPSEVSSDSGLHLHDHSDPEEDNSFFSARSAAGDDEDEQDSNDEEEEKSQDEEENDDGEMGELEQEYQTLQANQQSILQTLKQHRDDDVARGQSALWDKTLEMRFLLQKAFSTSNKLPKDPNKSRFCGHDQEIEEAYVELLDSSKQTLGCMLELQEGKIVEGDPELIDDSEFYHQLLKEFLESCDGASESAFYALRKKQQKRKLVDRRASKSRKIRYNVHEKLANFMAPVPITVPPMASKLFENLFGMGNQKATAA